MGTLYRQVSYVCSNRLETYDSIIYTRLYYVHNDYTNIHKYILYLECIHTCLFTLCTLHIKLSTYINFYLETWYITFEVKISIVQFVETNPDVRILVQIQDGIACICVNTWIYVWQPVMMVGPDNVESEERGVILMCVLLCVFGLLIWFWINL